MDYRLKDKVAIVTGGAQGLGEASARRFAQAGASVAIVDMKENKGQAVVQDIKANGGEAHFFACDLTKTPNVESLVANIEKTLGGIDVLYNNAGSSVAGTVETLAEEAYDQMFAINVKAKFMMSRYVVPVMRRGGSGSIINQASESGLTGSPYHPGYCASMGAVVNLTRAMALTHAPDKIRVNAVCPGCVETEILEAFLASVDDRQKVTTELLNDHPLGFGQAVDIANAALFLASDEARYVTGAIMSVDGGYTAR